MSFNHPLTMWSVNCLVNRLHSTVCSVQCSYSIEQCAVFSVQCAVFSVQLAVFRLQCAVCRVQCVQSLVCSVQCSECSVRNMQCVMCSVQSAVCAICSEPGTRNRSYLTLRKPGTCHSLLRALLALHLFLLFALYFFLGNKNCGVYGQVFHRTVIRVLEWGRGAVALLDG